VPVTDLDHAGTCALTSTGGIVVDLGRSPGGARSQVRAFDASGKLTWRAEVPAEVSVTADPAGARVAFIGGGRLQELDPRTGTPLRTLAGVRAARYDGAGALVVLDGVSASWR